MLTPQEIHPRLSTGRDLARSERSGHGERYETGIEALDRTLEGGLPTGRLVEMIGGPSSGRFSTLLALLARATGLGEAAALIDLGGHFTPTSAVAAGVDLERLLWVRPARLREASSSTEVVLAAGFPLVVLDLGVPPVPGGRGTEAAWLRLARAADRYLSALVVSTPYRATGTGAEAILRVRRTAADWRGRGRQPRLLAGLRFELSATTRRGRRRAASSLGDWVESDRVEEDATEIAAAG